MLIELSWLKSLASTSMRHAEHLTALSTLYIYIYIYWFNIWIWHTFVFYIKNDKKQKMVSPDWRPCQTFRRHLVSIAVLFNSTCWICFIMHLHEERSKSIKTKAVFTKQGMNKEGNFNFFQHCPLGVQRSYPSVFHKDYDTLFFFFFFTFYFFLPFFYFFLFFITIYLFIHIIHSSLV